MATKEFAQVLLNPQLFEDTEVTTNIPDPHRRKHFQLYGHRWYRCRVECVPRDRPGVV